MNTKFTLLAVFFCTISFFAHAVTPAFVWANSVGKDSSETVVGIKKDFAGNIYIAGSFDGVNVDFDPGAGTSLKSTNGLQDLYIVKYTAAGAFSWAITMGGTNADVVNGMDVDSAGNVYIVGAFLSTTLDMNPGAGTNNISNNAGFSAYFAKYNTSGVYQYAYAIGGSTSTLNTRFDDVKVTNDNVAFYVTGFSTDSTVDFDPGVGVSKTSALPNGDVIVAKYLASGTSLGAIGFIGTDGFDNGSRLHTDAAGNFFLHGQFQSTNLNIGTAASPINIPNGGAVGTQDVFYCKLSGTGANLGFIPIGSGGNESLGDITSNKAGFMYAIGRGLTGTDIDPFGPTPTMTSNGGWDIFMCKFELVAGTAVNTNTYGGVNNDFPLDIQIESDGKLSMAGQFAGTNVNVSTAGNPFNLSSNAGNWDGYYNRYDSSFNHITAFAVGGTNVDASRSILQTGNQIFMAGTYAGTANFDPNGTSNLTSLGQFDVYFSKYNLCGSSTPNVTLNRTICNGNAYFFKGANRTTTGTYIDTIKDNNGCDSILTLNLTVKPNSNPTISISTASSTTICPTASVTFNASITNGGPNPIYQWRRNASIVGSNSQTLVLNNLNNNDSIYCILTADDSCAIPKVLASNKIGFTVSTNRKHTVVITSNPATTTFCSGTSIQFTATSTNGGSNPSYSWKKNGFTVGTNSPTWTTTSLANNDSVWCIVSGRDSCASPTDTFSNKLKFTVNPNVTPTATIAVNPTGAICAGANATFSIATSSNLGSGPLYQWRKNGTLVGTNSTYASTTLAQGDAITLRITSNATCAAPDSVVTAPIVMNVNALNTPSVSISGVNSICVGQNTTFTATPTNGGTAPIYQWKVNGSNVGTNSTTYSSTGFTNGQVVSCEMTTNVTCPSATKANSNDITVQVNSLSAPAVSIAGPTSTLCSGQSLTYTATPTNGGSAPAYQWKVNGSNAGTNSSSFTTTLAGGDIVTCVMTSNSACASVPTANSNSLTITSAVTPTIAINSPTTSICAGESLTFTASITNGGSNPSLQWYKNGFMVSGQNGTSYTSSSFINSDQIYCELTSNAPCANPTKVNSNTKTITIVTTVVPTVSISTTTTTICAGTNVTFTASPGNGGTSPTYQWKINGSNIGSPSTTATFSSSTLANNDAVTCLMVSNSACASTPNANSNTLNMTVNPNLVPSVSVSPSPGNTICSGSAITFTASPTNGGSSPTYSWTIDGNAQASTTSVMGKTFTNAGTTPIQATVIVTLNVTAGFCATTNSALSTPLIVTINPILTPSITVSTPVTTICQGTNTTFTATPTNCGTTPSYQWKVNGVNAGLNSTSFSSTALANGDIVTCSVTPGGGCFSATSVNSNSVSMTVNSVKIPTASISNPNTTICQGTNATFTATITNGGSNPTYQWKLNGSNVGLNSNIYSNAALVNGDQVQLVLTSDAVCATPLTVNSNTIPMIVKAKPAKSTVTKLNATTLQSSVIGDSYVWKKDGTTLAPVTRNITVTALGDYTVAVILSGCTSDVSDPLTFIPSTSIKTFDEIGIKVYPNPVSDRIFVEMPNALLSKNNSIKFYSVSGQTIEIENQLTKTRNGFEITTENMSSGIYVIELENESGKAIYRVNIVK